MTVFYNFSGGMESAAMLALDLERIRDLQAIVRFADTGKHFPEMYESIRQVEARLGIIVVRVEPRITFDQFLFERGGMLRKGCTDCSRRMKRSNLNRHAKTFPPPYEINIGFNEGEGDRAWAFAERNTRDWCKWRFPLIEKSVSRKQTEQICREQGFSILLDMYERMGRLDCFWCPTQTDAQAAKVVQFYPDLATEWIEAERRKGHSFKSRPLPVIAREVENRAASEARNHCSCFGGEEEFDETASLLEPATLGRERHVADS